MDTPTKACTKCKIEKPMTTEYFCQDKAMKCGFRSWCRECRNESSRKWFAETNVPKKFPARVCVDGEDKFLGYYNTREEAAEAAKDSENKICFKCGIKKPFTSKFFRIEKRTKQGISAGTCRRCHCDEINVRNAAKRELEIKNNPDISAAKEKAKKLKAELKADVRKQKAEAALAAKLLKSEKPRKEPKPKLSKQNADVDKAKKEKEQSRLAKLAEQQKVRAAEEAKIWQEESERRKRILDLQKQNETAEKEKMEVLIQAATQKRLEQERLVKEAQQAQRKAEFAEFLIKHKVGT